MQFCSRLLSGNLELLPPPSFSISSLANKRILGEVWKCLPDKFGRCGGEGGSEEAQDMGPNLPKGAGVWTQVQTSEVQEKENQDMWSPRLIRTLLGPCWIPFVQWMAWLCWEIIDIWLTVKMLVIHHLRNDVLSSPCMMQQVDQIISNTMQMTEAKIQAHYFRSKS